MKKIKNHHDFSTKVILAGEISKRKNGKKYIFQVYES